MIVFTRFPTALYWAALLVGCLLCATHVRADELRIATFQADATPPLGSPLCEGAIPPVKEVVDPLCARGLVILGSGRPIVLCAVEWVGISNGGHDAWRAALAKAAGTSIDRVTVHTLHPHDAPGCDFAAEELLKSHGISGASFDVEFARRTIERTAAALAESLQNPRPVTHLGLGKGTVAQVASNRRVRGDDGKVYVVRYSASRDEKAIAAPEGVVDPFVRLVSLWNGDAPLLSMTHYATHPQSYYGEGGVSCDFVGLARELREQESPGMFHLHFNGAGGNIAAGKYNNGLPEVRPVLTKRLAAGMKAAWEDTERQPISANDVRWSSVKVTLPLASHLDEKSLVNVLSNPDQHTRERVRAANALAYVRRVQAGERIEIGCLKLGSARILYLPGELFVEYQLTAQALAPDKFVAMAAYGDDGPGYIGTRVAYPQGGYETSIVSRTAPEVEDVLFDAIRTLLSE